MTSDLHDLWCVEGEPFALETLLTPSITEVAGFYTGSVVFMVLAGGLLAANLTGYTILFLWIKDNYKVLLVDKFDIIVWGSILFLGPVS